MKMSPRFQWTPENVSSTKTAERSVRTYLEQAQLRDVLAFAAGVPVRSVRASRPFEDVAEIGCGFGRLMPVLEEFAVGVFGFERETELVAKASKLLPYATVVNVPELQTLPAEDGRFGLTMTFTVVQHMSDKDASQVLSETKRITAPDGYVLVVEDTNPHYHYQDKRDRTHFTHGRSVGWYREQLQPFELVKLWRRQVEPGYKHVGRHWTHVGHYMLFRGPGG